MAENILFMSSILSLQMDISIIAEMHCGFQQMSFYSHLCLQLSNNCRMLCGLVLLEPSSIPIYLAY